MRILLAMLVLSITAGCTTLYQPRYGDDGIYSAEHDGYSSHPLPASGYSAHYPYWSLDHFYFSRYYAPFSVIVHPFDPWYYPYSAWYWGYPYTHGAFFARHYSYYGWGPWHRTHSYRRHRPIADQRDYRGRRLASDSTRPWPGAGHRAHRLDRLGQQRSRRGGDGMVTDNNRPASQPGSRSSTPSRRAATSSRSTSRPASTRPARNPARVPQRVRNAPPSS